MRERELLRAGIGAQRGRVEGRVNAVVGCDAAEIVAQRFALVAEAGLYEFEKGPLVAHAEGSTLAGQRHAHERGCDARRRTKRAGRNPQDNFGACVELAGG